MNRARAIGTLYITHVSPKSTYTILESYAPPNNFTILIPIVDRLYTYVYIATGAAKIII